MENEKLTIKEIKQNTKANFIKILEKAKSKIENLYLKGRGEKNTPILYPLTQDLIELYKTIDKNINKLKTELEQERKQL